MSQITEWTFTAEAASTINEIVKERPDLPFSRSTVEERGKGSRKRRDLTIYDRKGQPVLTGEVKMPDRPDGRSPYADPLVNDAHAKADREGVDYFFTWNVNRLVIWKTFEKHKPITQRDIEPLELANPIRRSDDLLHPRVQMQIREFIRIFLDRASAIISGAAPIPYRPLDEKFIFIWEAALDPLVRETLGAITQQYDQARFRLKLDEWMRDDQGWTLSKDDNVVNDNLERAAKFSCYVLANKIIFYKALRRRFKGMRALRIPAAIDSGKALHGHLVEQFEHAIAYSRDYQTVFRGDFGDGLPFLSDGVVDLWRMLNQDTDAFDFTEINYEIIGQIFERMLRGDERHRFGQHYTRSEIVDLINTFCIRTAKAKILDPACGGGTFLVRAYDRKKALSQGHLAHEEEIDQLFGMDISAYPTHLTTINLATRDLVQSANYPLVVRKDFFDVNVNDSIFHIPDPKGELQWKSLPSVDAVIGNPPYVRHEKLNEYYGTSYKKHLQELTESEWPGLRLSGRSDILCFFFQVPVPKV